MQKWQSPEGRDSLKTLVEKYKKANRTGCAILYVGQMTHGDEQLAYLKQAIADYSDCFNGDGVQVGAFARFLLGQAYLKSGNAELAEPLFDEIRKNYPDCVDHQGNSLVAQLPQGTPEPVSITVGVNFFKYGDSITITEVKATSPDLKWGDKVIVKGYYTLATEPKARLCLFATAVKGPGTGPIRSGQTISITKGEGAFELSETLECDGRLHVTFYSVPGGKPFGGVYFGTAKQMEEIKNWDVQKWYTAEPTAARDGTDRIVSEPGHSSVEPRGGQKADVKAGQVASSAEASAGGDWRARRCPLHRSLPARDR